MLDPNHTSETKKIRRYDLSLTFVKNFNINYLYMSFIKWFKIFFKNEKIRRYF